MTRPPAVAEFEAHTQATDEVGTGGVQALPRDSPDVARRSGAPSTAVETLTLVLLRRLWGIELAEQLFSADSDPALGIISAFAGAID